MKKALKNWVCLLAVLCMIAGFIPVNAQAYEKKGHYRIYNLAQSKWVSNPDNGKNITNVYKIRVPSDGYIKVSVTTKYIKNKSKALKRRFSKIPVMLYTWYNVDSDFAIDKYFIADFLSGESYMALKKGTYYFRPSCYGLRFKWEHAAVNPGSNDRMSRAETMTSGKTKRVYFAYSHEFTKWYKITLTKKHKIQVFARRMERRASYANVFGPGFQITVVNSKGKKINTTKSSEYTQLTRLLPKGTYYICLKRLTPKTRREGYGDRLIHLNVTRK